MTVRGTAIDTSLSTSVLIPSYRRPQALTHCLEGLAAQTVLPAEVLVIWQDDDTATRDCAAGLAASLPYELHLVHSETTGIVPAENAGLARARGKIIVMIDDDAIPPPGWLASHLCRYRDSSIGSVGGPARNYRLDGQGFPTRAAKRFGRITWYGKLIGNLFDHDRTFGVIEVEHLAGGNMSFRRDAIDRFEDRLRPYWQYFEADACLQIGATGYRIVYDSENPIAHYPTNTLFDGTREGDLTRKVFNAAYNHAFILAKHSRPGLRLPRLAYLLGIGSLPYPGIIGFLFAPWRYGKPLREMRVFSATFASHLAGWIAGSRARSTARRGTAATSNQTKGAIETGDPPSCD